MEALVLEKQHELKIRDIQLDEPLGSHDVRIALRTVGVCGSDVHYYEHGRIGHFVVRAPMVLGHEASGVITEVGSEVTHLKVGDRVCMEPGIPDPVAAALTAMSTVPPTRDTPRPHPIRPGIGRDGSTRQTVCLTH